MSETTDKDRLAATAKQHFDESVERLDAATLSRLNRGRHAALAELQGRRRFTAWQRWVPATGVVAAAVLVAMVMRGPESIEFAIEPTAATDIELLLDEAQFEMIEDLEFYSWLETADLDANNDVG